MVTINLRHDFNVSLNRNSNIPAWVGLFEHCATHYPDVLFVIIGRKNTYTEVIPRTPNILFSKDYNDTVCEDIALMYHSQFHMGATSGLVSCVFLSRTVPYALFNFRMDGSHHPFHTTHPNVIFPWQNKKLQHVLWGPEDRAVLIKEFEYLYEQTS